MTQKEFFEAIAENEAIESHLREYAEEQVEKLEARRIAANIRRSEKREKEIAPRLEIIREILTTEPQTADQIWQQAPDEEIFSFHKTIALLNNLSENGEIEKGYLTVDKKAKRSYKLKEKEEEK